MTIEPSTAEESAFRRELHYPPFSRLVLVELRGPDGLKVEAAALALGEKMKRTNGWFTVLGPAPAVIARVRNNYRWHAVIKYAREHDPSGTPHAGTAQDLSPAERPGAE